MALTFDSEDRFQLGLMEDAAECFVSRYASLLHDERIVCLRG